MNKYEERAQRERKAGLRSATAIWTAGMLLVAVVFAIIGLSRGTSGGLWSRAAIILAVLLLVVRQLNRRTGTRSHRAAEPDPQSRLKLD